MPEILRAAEPLVVGTVIAFAVVGLVWTITNHKKRKKEDDVEEYIIYKIPRREE